MLLIPEALRFLDLPAEVGANLRQMVFGALRPLPPRRARARAMSRILAFAGSLRKGSLNRRLLRNAIEGVRAAGGDVEELAPEALALPLYNGDLEQDGRFPPEVEAWRARIAGAEGLLIASPEYKHGMSGETVTLE